MRKEQRTIYHDMDLQIDLYEFYGIMQHFNNHFHKEYIIGFIKKGKRDFICNNRQYFLDSGDILLINPLEIHSCKSIDDEDLHYFSFNISKQIMQKVILEITGENILPHFNIAQIKTKDLTILLQDLKQLIITKQSKLAKEEVFLLLIETLVKNFSDIKLTVDIHKTSEKIEEICNYLEENFAKNIMLEDLSSLTNISKYHLIRLFTKEKGITPHKYLETIRVENSKTLLKQGETIIEVALKSGFTDQSHFTNSFKSLIGLTPKIYQKIMQK